MKEHTYLVSFPDVGITISETALIGEVAVSKAEKELKEMYGGNLQLGNKVSFRRVD